MSIIIERRSLSTFNGSTPSGVTDGGGKYAETGISALPVMLPEAFSPRGRLPKGENRRLPDYFKGKGFFASLRPQI